MREGRLTMVALELKRAERGILNDREELSGNPRGSEVTGHIMPRALVGRASMLRNILRAVVPGSHRHLGPIRRGENGRT